MNSLASIWSKQPWHNSESTASLSTGLELKLARQNLSSRLSKQVVIYYREGDFSLSAVKQIKGWQFSSFTIYLSNNMATVNLLPLVIATMTSAC